MQAADLYLDLLKKCLSRFLFPDRNLLEDLTSTTPFDPSVRAEGKDWPVDAETMIGLRRLDNLEDCIVSVVEENIPGDLLEAGVWRGGASILMRAVLEAYGDATRNVWLADSFRGLPQPDPARYPRDQGDPHHRFSDYLGVPMEVVQANFERYGLLDERVRFLPGWFKDTLPTAPIGQIAVLRVDGDMYESTIQVLENLYWKVPTGGYVIVDDFGALASCRVAVEDFRAAGGITEPMFGVDWTGIFWRKGYFSTTAPPLRSLQAATLIGCTGAV